jgi:hypothetical protein
MRTVRHSQKTWKRQNIIDIQAEYISGQNTCHQNTILSFTVSSMLSKSKDLSFLNVLYVLLFSLFHLQKTQALAASSWTGSNAFNGHKLMHCHHAHALAASSCTSCKLLHC